MKLFHAGNERIKRVYLEDMKEAKGYSEQTIDAIATALARFERFTKFADVHDFKKDQAIDFKEHLSAQTNARTRERLSKATIFSTVNALRGFVQWLSREPGYKRRIKWRDADYFTLARGDAAIARASRERRFPTVEQVRHVIDKMPHVTEAEMRDRAIVALTLMTGARVAAIASMRLMHADLAGGKVDQNAKHVNTKFRKTFPTFFMQVGEDVLRIFADWVTYLRTQKLWGNDDPLFPATKVVVGKSGHFEVAGIDRKPWKTTTHIRAVFKSAFEAAGLPYYHPHSLRHTLTHFAMDKCTTPESFKAVSQNLAHNDVLTTLMNYGTVSSTRQADIIRSMGKEIPDAVNIQALAREIAEIKEQIRR
jgi:integrase/recombinase XerD